MARWNGNIIENPEAYNAAIKASIFARATAKRRKAWEAANPVLAEWANHHADDMITLDGGRTYVNNPNARHAAGTFPSFARDGLNKWGSLSEKGTATLQRIYDERMASNAARAEQRALEAASATAWTAGRYEIVGTVLSTKAVESDFGTSFKMLVQRQDGSKIYTTIPSNMDRSGRELRGKLVRFTATVQPKDGEPTFAFGSRPAKAVVLEVTLTDADGRGE